MTSPVQLAWCINDYESFYMPEPVVEGELIPECPFCEDEARHRLVPYSTWICTDCYDPYGFRDEQEFYEHMEEYHRAGQDSL